jgi:integrase
MAKVAGSTKDDRGWNLYQRGDGQWAPRASGPESQGDFWKVYPHTEGGHELAVYVDTGVRRVRRKLRVPKKYETAAERARWAKGAAHELRRLYRAGVTRTATVREPDAIDATRLTFADVADLWTSGELAKKYPDHVSAKKTADLDAQRLAVLKESVGGVAIQKFQLLDAERAMRELPERCRTTATRRQYAQLLVRVLGLAVYPLRVIDHTPIPRGFLPKVKNGKAMSFLYPVEDAKLLACREVPLARRILYGVLAREGMRAGELVNLQWKDVDLERGIVNLDENKTDDPRMWALDPGVVRALVAWKKIHPKNDPEDDDNDEAMAKARVIVDTNGSSLRDVTHAAYKFREHLDLVDVDRPQLFEKSANRQPIRVHDLRATFVTLSLANGKTETWVADRTGHKSSSMINRYRRTARVAQELALGTMAPLDLAIPELSGGGTETGSSAAGSEVSRKVSRSVVHGKGVEPSRLAAAEPKSAASASFATRALFCCPSARL